MSLSYKFAITAAVAYSAVSLYDAVYHGVTGRGTIFSDMYGTTWASMTGSVTSAIAFTAFAVALVSGRARIDGGSRVRRWIRRLLTVDFAILAGVYAIGAPFLGDPGSRIAAALGIVAGVAFAAMFVLAFGLGASLLRVGELRVSAVLLVSVVPLIGLTVALNAVGSAFAHPAYAETAIYFGVALLAWRPVAAPSPAPAAVTQLTPADTTEEAS